MDVKFIVFALLIIVIAVVQIIAYYSIGRSHEGKLQISYPSMQEWIYLIIIGIVANWATTSVTKKFIGKELNVNDTIASVMEDM